MGEILFMVSDLEEEQGTFFSSVMIVGFFDFDCVLCLTSLLQYVPNTSGYIGFVQDGMLHGVDIIIIIIV